jgi:hypothetical protein
MTTKTEARRAEEAKTLGNLKCSWPRLLRYLELTWTLSSEAVTKKLTDKDDRLLPLVRRLARSRRDVWTVAQLVAPLMAKPCRVCGDDGYLMSDDKGHDPKPCPYCANGRDYLQDLVERAESKAGWDPNP